MNDEIHSSGPGVLCVHICSRGTAVHKMLAALKEVGLRPNSAAPHPGTDQWVLTWYHDITDEQWTLVDRAERLAGGEPPGEYLEVPLESIRIEPEP